ETLPLAAMEAMQFGHALDRILREILLADPAHGPVQLLKVDISDGFYRINLNIDDIPKLGVAFPTKPGEEKLVAFPLVLPMGWKNSPPIFSTGTETAADLANQRLAARVHPAPHRLDDAAETVPSPPPDRVAIKSILKAPKKQVGTAVPTTRDPSLPTRRRAATYIDVFVDDFVALAQQPGNGRRVRRILMHAIDDVFRPLDELDDEFRREPISLKKLLKGIGRAAFNVAGAARRATPVQSHAIALSKKVKSRVNLMRGVHDSLEDFRWLLNDIKRRPTRIAELVPLLAAAEGHHDASGTGAGGVWFPAKHLVPRRAGVLSSMDAEQADRFVRDLGAAKATIAAGVSVGRAKAAETVWEIWQRYCSELGIDPFLEAKTKYQSYKSSHSEYALENLTCGQPPSRPRSIAWKKRDPPPHRVKPLPVQVIRRMANVAMHSRFERTKAVADMTILAFFFLLRPGEYVDTNSESTPFKIEDVNFYIGDTWINPATASEQQLLAATRVTLTFTTQKNGVRGEIIGLCTSGDPIMCPVRAAIRRVLYLRRNGAPVGTPLGRVFPEVGETKADRLQPKHITAAIRDAVKFYGTDLGFLPEDVSARSLRAAGANDLLSSWADRAS
ncbi:hypothetical protein THAOC_18432, partial [Thalassiosira oceanica]